MSKTSLLSDIIAQACRHFAARPCLSQGDRRWTFAELHAEVESLAAGMSARWPTGARVGLFMANRPEYLILQCAIERAGLVRVPLNARFTAHDVTTIVDDCRPVAVLHDSGTAPRLETLGHGRDISLIDVDDEQAWRLLHGSVAVARAAPSADALCSINYTSGTSGKPKGVMLSHRNWSALTRNMLIDRDIRGDDVVAHVGPLTHASGTYFAPWLLRGARQVVVQGSSVEELMRAIERERVTVFSCVPTLLTRIVNHPERERYDLSSLRAIFYGAEPIPLNTLIKAHRQFGPILTQNYGLTEAMMTVATLSAADHVVPDEVEGGVERRHGCIGRPYTFVEVELRDESGKPVPTGSVGEISIRSEHMTAGYWERPDETARLLRDGWLWTGDLARFDEAGYLYLAGRSKDMLISGGFNIYPAELEAALTGHPAIAESGVVGVPDPSWGEVPVAFVVTAPQSRVTVEELDAFCKPILGFRRPSRIILLDAIPKNVNGKLDKPKLRELALARMSHA